MPDALSSPTPDSPPVDPATLVGKTISDRYKVESLLGSGGMGAVYLVQHTLMRKRFALKVLNSDTAQVPEMVARFEREAMAAVHIEHPNIAVATDFGKTEDGAFFLVLEYLEGQRLRDALAAGPLELRRAMHITRQIASALERSHQLGVIHRDLKPENIMLVTRQGDRDFVKVLDFGLAKVQSTTPGSDAPAQVLTRHGTVVGTPRYMAPEQCIGSGADGRTDLYALGLILYEMLTGANPFDHDDFQRVLRQQLSMPLPAIKIVAPAVSVPASLEALVKRLTEKDPEARYQDATALLAALSEVAEREGILPPELSSGAVTPLPRSAAAKDAAGVETFPSLDVVEAVSGVQAAKSATPDAKTLHSMDIVAEVAPPPLPPAKPALNQADTAVLTKPPLNQANTAVLAKPLNQANTAVLAKPAEAETRAGMAAVTVGSFNPADLEAARAPDSPPAPVHPSFLRPLMERLPPDMQKIPPALLLGSVFVLLAFVLLMLLR